MGAFGVNVYDGKEHYFAVLSPEDLSVSKKIHLPFDKGENVYAGSCCGLLYFHGEKGKIVIVSTTTNEMIVVPPPDFEPLPHEGTLVVSGLGYDVKSGDYKLIRHYLQVYNSEPDEDGLDRFLGCKKFLELYRFNSFGLWEELKRPGYGILHDATGVYVGETGSCYWVGSHVFSGEDYFQCLYLTAYEAHFRQAVGFAGSVDSIVNYVLSFDFATESLGRFPLPATAICLAPSYKLVRYCSSLGALAFGASSTDVLSIEFFVWKGQGRSWERVYDVVLFHDVERPVGFKDHFLFLESKLIGGRSQLMVYDFDTKQLKKLNIYNDDYVGFTSVIPYGAEITDPPAPDYIPKAYCDFSRKMRRSKKGKGKGKGKGKRKGKKSRG